MSAGRVVCALALLNPCTLFLHLISSAAFLFGVTFMPLFPFCPPSFLLQPFELNRIEELPQGDVESLAYPLDGYHARVLALIVEDALDGGLRDTCNMAQGVGRDVPFPAKLPYPACDSFLCSHGNPSM